MHQRLLTCAEVGADMFADGFHNHGWVKGKPVRAAEVPRDCHPA
jgi:hypothetical protein